MIGVSTWHKQKLVVIGNGMAGARAVEEILARGGGDSSTSRCSATSPTATTTASCCPTSSTAARTQRDLPQPAGLVRGERHPPARRRAGHRHRPRRPRLVYGDDGVASHYDKLLIATGSRAFIPPIEGMTDADGKLQAGRVRVPHAGRLRRHHRATRRQSKQRGRDRRRPARPGSGARAAQPRLRGARHPPRRASDGAAARCAAAAPC